MNNKAQAHKLTQIAEAVFDPTNPIACEGSCALHHTAMVLREDTLTNRVFRLIAKVLP